MKRRLSTPRAATVIVLAAAVAVSVTVVPSLAQSFLTKQAAQKVFVTNKAAKQTYVSSKAAKQTYVSNKAANQKFVSKASASALYLNKKAAANLYLAKKAVPLTPVASIAAGTTPFSAAATTAGYIPSAFTSFATKTAAAKTIITFSGPASCTTVKASTPDQACPVQILVDGTSTGKVNFAPATIEGSATKPAATNIHTIVQTTVLGKGGHVVQVQYAGASNVTFNLKSWNLAVTAYPEPEEELSFPGEEKEKSGGSGGTTK